MTDDGQRYVQALGLELDPAWRRRTPDERYGDGCEFEAAHDAAIAQGVHSVVHSSIGLEPGMDLLLWRWATSVDALEASAAALLTAGLGRWARVSHSLIGRVGPSQYVRRPTDQEQAPLESSGKRYLVVYPFTKSTEWYLLSREARQGVMNEHMRVGHDYPTISQVLAYSFGLDSQDFVVAYETDDLVAFGDLVRALRSTESRRSTVNDSPILLGIHRPLPEILDLLGAGR
jgi:chlorite dismutase